MPDITEMSKHIMMEETKQGLNIEIVDQDGRSMFPEGSKEPHERTRRLIQRLAAPLKATAFRLSIVGHSSASRIPPRPGYGPWELSADRANAVRKLLEMEGGDAGLAHLHGGRKGRHAAAFPR
jgi:chemotaxis protein MotB